MKEEHNAALDDLLGRWHGWMKNGGLGRTGGARGYAMNSCGFGSYRASRQMDDWNGALDGALNARSSRAVNFAAEHMQDPHQAMIYMEARNLYTGLSVWNSPRIPQEPKPREICRQEARAIMCGLLIKAGVI